MSAVREGDVSIAPAMSTSSPDGWSGALWIGEIELSTIMGGNRLELASRDGYARARLLIREAGLVRGFVELPIPNDGRLAIADILAAAEALPEAEAATPLSGTPPWFSVVICTRDRPDLLRVALRSVLEIEYPSFEIVVVDNASGTDATRQLVESEFGSQAVTLVSEPTPGLATARNAGLQIATGEFVAFTDDDVVVDPQWLAELARGFALGDEVSCVSGLVPTGELRTETQLYFDQRVSWSRNLRQRIFSMKQRPKDLPMFPFSVGEFGTGANFAVRRETVMNLRGFDTAFGVGTRTGGGEDIDMFTRVLLSGHELVIRPSAIVWHRHRHDIAALQSQARSYGTGLGAWLTKIAIHPRTFWLAVSRSPWAAVRVLSMARRTNQTESADQINPELRREIRRVGLLELMYVARGPLAYARERRAGAGLMPK